MRISWPYVAGFFDGEGHLSSTNKSKHVYQSWVLGITQKDVRPLLAIQTFLASHGITAYVRPHDLKSGRGINRLSVTRGRDIARVLRFLLPYLIVKKQLAEDLWRMLSLWPPFSRAAVARLASAARWPSRKNMTTARGSDGRWLKLRSRGTPAP